MLRRLEDVVDENNTGEPGFFATWASITFRPSAFFSSPAASRGRALRFALLLGALRFGGWGLLAGLLRSSSFPQAVAAALGAALFSPILVLIGLYATAGLVHTCLWLVRGRRAPFGRTVEAVAYGSAPLLFGVVPVLGGAVGLVWSWVTTVIALSRTHETNTSRSLFSTLAPFLTSIFLAFGLRAYVVEAFQIPSGGVIPTLQVGDHIFVTKYAYRWSEPKRGDVIVFKYPPEPDKDFIKRVIAVGGDTVEIRDNVVYVNGAAVPREHVDEPCSYEDYDDSAARWEKHHCEAFRETLGDHSYTIVQEANAPARSWQPRQVPPHSFFVMGDNRDNSHDSRFWGTVPLDHVKGRASIIWFSSGGSDHAIRTERIFQRVQ